MGNNKIDNRICSLTGCGIQTVEDTIERIFKIIDHNWDAQSWKDLSGFEYSEALRLRTKVDQVSNILRQETGKDFGITAKQKMILANYLVWFEGLF
jgi:hypothetical protein